MKKLLLFIPLFFSFSVSAEKTYHYNLKPVKASIIEYSAWNGDIHKETGTIYDPNGYDKDGLGVEDCNLDYTFFFNTFETYDYCTSENANWFTINGNYAPSDYNSNYIDFNNYRYYRGELLSHDITRLTSSCKVIENLHMNYCPLF